MIGMKLSRGLFVLKLNNVFVYFYWNMVVVRLNVVRILSRNLIVVLIGIRMEWKIRSRMIRDRIMIILIYIGKILVNLVDILILIVVSLVMLSFIL